MTKCGHMRKLTGLDVVPHSDGSGRWTIRLTYNDGEVIEQDRHPTRERAERAIRRAFNRIAGA